jgi:imidazolonepropionase-like amidohydrolase
MTPLQVISAATKTNAEILGLFGDRGSLEVGKRADILIVQGNPLEDISTLGNVAVVVKQGELWFTEGSTVAPATRANFFGGGSR